MNDGQTLFSVLSLYGIVVSTGIGLILAGQVACGVIVLSLPLVWIFGMSLLD